MLEQTKVLSPKPFYSRLAFLAFALAFVVIILGAYTRLTNAGLSCPDWPRCYGYLTPPLNANQLEIATHAYPQVPVDKAKAWTEMRHRYLAGLEGLLILALVSLSWYWRKELKPGVFKLSQALIGIMLGQILLGMLTVTALLKPVVVLGHLLFGFSVMSVLWVIWLLTRKNNSVMPAKAGIQETGAMLDASLRWHDKGNSRLGPWVSLGLVILILQISLGGWVSTHSAGLACIDFPYCNGQLLPHLQVQAFNTDLITMHMLHRLGALVTFLYLSLLSFFLYKETKSFGILVFFLLSTQVILGILNILWLRPVDIALPHHAVAALLLLSLLALRVKLYHQGKRT